MNHHMSKVLIGILSCHSLRHWEQAVRETWIPDITAGTDHRFFLGLPIVPAEQDEVFLSVNDSFQGITEKTVAMYRWALENGYDWCFKADLDTLVRPQALLQSDFRQFDWVGGQNSVFASGGAGYCLSRKAMQIVVDHPMELGPAEDVNMAHALLSQGIALHADDRYKFTPGSVLDSHTLTYHLASVKAWDAKATPEELRQAYAGTFKLPTKEVRTRTGRWLRRAV